MLLPQRLATAWLAYGNGLRGKCGRCDIICRNRCLKHFARACGYGNFYFMEMNTRIQVEHPVTEMITGIDLIREQILVAQGEKLQIKQDQVIFRGHSIECRINAEDPDHNFRPHPGKISGYLPPGGPGVRMDSHVYTDYEIPPYYDSLIGKLIVWGENRDIAIKRMKRALRECAITGVPTTIDFHRKILETPAFLAGDVYTNFIQEHLLP